MDNKLRYNSYSEYFKKNFGKRVQKLSVDAGFTCPNRDGSKGVKGCTYCNNNAFNPSYCSPDKPVLQQIEEGINFHNIRYRHAEKYLVYFQPYSNTYAKLDSLKKIYDQVLNIDNILGIVIGTRPDCMDDEKLEYFAKLSEKHYVIIEYGIESCYDETLKKINRCQSYQETAEMIKKTAQYGIKVGGHIIFGLPGENKQQMLDEASILSKLPLDTIKFHQLQIIKNTIMEQQYINNPDFFSFFALDDYIEFIIDFVERFNPNTVIERFAGEVPPRFLAGPGWGLIRNDEIVTKIKRRLEERDTFQGKFYNPN